MTLVLRFLVSCLVASPVAVAAPPTASLSFEEATRMSDRIVVGTVQGTGGGSVRLPNGRDLELGIKDRESGLVFTPYRIRIATCLFDTEGSCTPGETEVLIPGGTVYETVEGTMRLRTWEIAGAAGVPLPPVGDEVVLFLTKRSGRYVPLNDSSARLRIDRASGAATVMLRFASPRFLSQDALVSARALLAAGSPATTRPVFIEAVGIDRLKSLIELARQVPMPTSGRRHAIPDGVHASDFRALGVRRNRVRAGEDSHRLESSLGHGDDCD